MSGWSVRGPGRANRVTMGDGAAIDVDNVLRQSELSVTTMAMAAKASIDLHANPHVQGSSLARSSACLTAGMGPRPNMPGSTAAMPYETRRPAARGHASRPCLIASTNPAAPLFTPGAFPAVIVPPSRKAGFSLAQCLEGCARTVVLVCLERRRTLSPRQFHWD